MDMRLYDMLKLNTDECRLVDKLAKEAVKKMNEELANNILDLIRSEGICVEDVASIDSSTNPAQYYSDILEKHGLHLQLTTLPNGEKILKLFKLRRAVRIKLGFNCSVVESNVNGQ